MSCAKFDQQKTFSFRPFVYLGKVVKQGVPYSCTIYVFISLLARSSTLVFINLQEKKPMYVFYFLRAFVFWNSHIATYLSISVKKKNIDVRGELRERDSRTEKSHYMNQWVTNKQTTASKQATTKKPFLPVRYERVCEVWLVGSLIDTRGKVIGYTQRYIGTYIVTRSFPRARIGSIGVLNMCCTYTVSPPHPYHTRTGEKS